MLGGMAEQNPNTPKQVNRAIVRLLTAVDKSVAATDEVKCARRDLAGLIEASKEGASDA